MGYRRKATVTVLGALGALSVSALLAINVRDHHQRLIEELPPNRALELRQLFGQDVSGACLLPPYASTVVDPSHRDFTLLVNQHLSATGYVGSEDAWAIVADHAGKLRTYNIRRTARSDIGATASLQLPDSLPAGVLAGSCIIGRNLAFLKVERADRQYLVLVEK